MSCSSNVNKHIFISSLTNIYFLDPTEYSLSFYEQLIGRKLDVTKFIRPVDFSLQREFILSSDLEDKKLAIDMGKSHSVLNSGPPTTVFSELGHPIDKFTVIDMTKWIKETKTVGTSSQKGNYLIKTVCQYIVN